MSTTTEPKGIERYAERTPEQAERLALLQDHRATLREVDVALTSPTLEAVELVAAPRVWPENFWREVWHQDCPKGLPDPPMIHHRLYALIEDGSSLRLYECTRCGVKAWAGLDATRRVVSRRFEDLTPIPGSR